VEDPSWSRLCGSLWPWPFTRRECEKQKRGVPGVAGGLTSGFQGGDAQEGLERHYLPLRGGGFGGVGAGGRLVFSRAPWEGSARIDA